MGAPKRHVAIPKCLLEQFSIKGHVWVYDFSLNKVFSSSCSTTGAETNYYEIEAENLLSEYESRLASFISDITKLTKHNEITNYVNEHHDSIIEFFNYQFQRSKKILEQTNKQSAYAKSRGGISHSELIQIAKQIGDRANVLQILGGKLFALHVVCDENQFLSTNSLGFYAITDNKKIRYFALPISKKLAIIIQANYDKNNSVSHYTLTNEINEYFNKCCVRMEKELGNGLIIANSESELRTILAQNNIVPGN